MSTNRYTFMQAEDQTWSLYKIDKGRSTILASGINDPTVKVTVRTVQKPAARAALYNVRSYSVAPLDLEGEDTFIEDVEMDVEVSKEEPGFFASLFNDICEGVSDAVSFVKDGVMTLFSPSEEQVQQAKEIEKASNTAVKTQQQQQHRIAINGVGPSIFQTIEQAIGNVPDRKAVSNLTNSKIYGASTATLCYPSDLLADGNPYNGMYTVFYISEHAQSTIASIEDGAFTTGTKYVNNQGSTFAKTMNNLSEEEQLAAQLVIGLGGAYAATKTIASTVGNVLGVASPGSGKESNTNFLMRGAVATAGVASMAALVAPVVGNVATNIDRIKTEGASKVIKEAVQRCDLTRNNLDFKQLQVAIALPTPQVEMSSIFSWKGDTSLALSGGLLKTFGEVAKDGGSGDILAGADKANTNAGIMEMLTKIGTKVADKMAKVSEIGGEAMTALATSNSKLGGVVSRMTGSTTNTRKEMLFEDVPFREFSFKYQLAARSPEEMQNIESIIRVFKYHGYPELSKNEFLYRYPAQFDIVHYFGDTVNSHMPRHATCVLTKVDVDYSGGQSFTSVHYDGSPVNITLTLGFKEIAVLTKDSIAQGY